jgi:hypothetical protein
VGLVQVRLLAAEYELDPEELYRKVHKQLVRSAFTYSLLTAISHPS